MQPNNLSAFPSGLVDPKTPDDVIQAVDKGMSLRDYLATHCAIDAEHSATYAEAVMGRKAPSYGVDPKAHAIFAADFRAKLRYIEADAMLRARGHGQA